jgi:hypothetical protein
LLLLEQPIAVKGIKNLNIRKVGTIPNIGDAFYDPRVPVNIFSADALEEKFDRIDCIMF